MIGVYNHLLSKVFRFHYHSQKVIGSLGQVCEKKRRSQFTCLDSLMRCVSSPGLCMLSSVTSLAWVGRRCEKKWALTGGILGQSFSTTAKDSFQHLRIHFKESVLQEHLQVVFFVTRFWKHFFGGDNSPVGCKWNFHEFPYKGSRLPTTMYIYILYIICNTYDFTWPRHKSQLASMCSYRKTWKTQSRRPRREPAMFVQFWLLPYAQDGHTSDTASSIEWEQWKPNGASGKIQVPEMHIYHLYDDMTIYTWSPNDLYFWRSIQQKNAFSNQNKGHLGSRKINIYIYILSLYIYIYRIYMII